ncbi:MAG: phytoene desaturase [Verrucomicrobiales bacterium]|nr:phytoene desaturase [Verrucomicrobiales bacterium]
MSKEIIIVGAGPGGLAASILLAASGLKVSIFERLPVVGGRTSTLESGGFKFDLGPTFFLYPQVLREIFAAGGSSFDEEVPMTRLDPQYRLIFGAGGELRCTPNVAEMQRQIAAINPEDARQFPRFLAENRVKLQAMMPCLQNPFLGWGDLLNMRMLKLLPMIRPHQSVDTYLGGFFRDPRIRLAFSFQSKYLGMSPFRCPSLFSILSFLEYEYGVFHPTGGCGSITRALARLAERLGVRIHLGEPVEEILFQGRRATGIRTASGSHRADALVVNADFARAMSRLVPDQRRKRWSNAKLERKKYSCSTFMMYLGVDGTFEQPHHNIYIAKDYRQNLLDIEERHTLSDDPSFYVENPSITDPTLAPKGQSALYVLLPVSHQHPNIDWNREKSRFRQLALRRLSAAGFNLSESQIRFERIVTPADWDTRYEIFKGATFNLAHSLDQMLHLRPRNRFEEFDGMYLVGGGTHPGSGLPVIFESARISSRLLLEDLGVSPCWRPATGVPSSPTLAPELQEA